MGDRPTVAIRANSPEQKEKWKEAVESSEEYDSLSHLIRRAVTRELAGEHDPTPTPDAGGIDDQRLDNLTEAVERIDARLEDMGETVERLENQNYEEGGITDETLQEVFANLPMGETDAILGEAETRVSKIAQRIDLPQVTVEMALEQLRNDIASVHRTEMSDEYGYYREA